jgi:glycosyltransferase involved in cell wall biosynthesis
MDLFALSSDTEQMPLAVLEAMGTGLAVVSTDVGDVREMVSAENQAYVTPLGNDEAFFLARGELVQGMEQRVRLGRMNRTRCIAVYDLPAMLDRYRDLYRDVITRH